MNRAYPTKKQFIIAIFLNSSSSSSAMGIFTNDGVKIYARFLCFSLQQFFNQSDVKLDFDCIYSRYLSVYYLKNMLH